MNLLAHEPLVRVGAFFSILLLMAAWECIAPRRALTVAKTTRWVSNLGLAFLNTLLLRALFPSAAVGLAIVASRHGWGVLNQVNLAQGMRLVVGMVALDFAIYFQHVLFHAVPSLWRLHRVHHADLDFDVTTGARFHPLEMVISMLIKLAVIMALGAPPLAVLLLELVLSATAIFNHSNARVPLNFERVLRSMVVTPDMHRVHHSVLPNEANSNFGFNISLWDRLLGTYRAQPQNGHLGMVIGIHDYRDPRQVSRLAGMLALPFKGKAAGNPINSRAHNVEVNHAQ